MTVKAAQIIGVPNGDGFICLYVCPYLLYDETGGEQAIVVCWFYLYNLYKYHFPVFGPISEFQWDVDVVVF